MGDVRALYYREQEMRGEIRPALRVVAIEDLWETLVAAHQELSHGGRDRMAKYFQQHGYHMYRPVIQLFLDLCQTCQSTRGRKSTQKIIHKPIIPDTVGVRGQADLVDLQMLEDNGYKFILNYQDCFSKFVILRPLKTKTAHEVADCLVDIFLDHGPPSILHTDNGAEFSNKTLLARIKELWTSTHIVHGRPRHPQDQGSVERANGDFKNMLYARLKESDKPFNQWKSRAIAIRRGILSGSARGFTSKTLVKSFSKKNSGVKYLEIPLSNEVDATIGLYHNVTNPGIYTTIDGIRNKYDWNGIYNNVGDFIKTCHDCQTSAAQPQREIQPIPPPEQPWYHCGIDLVCNMSRTTQGFQHIVVMVC